MHRAVPAPDLRDEFRVDLRGVVPGAVRIVNEHEDAGRRRSLEERSPRLPVHEELAGLGMHRVREEVRLRGPRSGGIGIQRYVEFGPTLLYELDLTATQVYGGGAGT